MQEHSERLHRQILDLFQEYNCTTHPGVHQSHLLPECKLKVGRLYRAPIYQNILVVWRDGLYQLHVVACLAELIDRPSYLISLEGICYRALSMSDDSSAWSDLPQRNSLPIVAPGFQ